MQHSLYICLTLWGILRSSILCKVGSGRVGVFLYVFISTIYRLWFHSECQSSVTSSIPSPKPQKQMFTNSGCVHFFFYINIWGRLIFSNCEEFVNFIQVTLSFLSIIDLNNPHFSLSSEILQLKQSWNSPEVLSVLLGSLHYLLFSL